MRNRIMAVLTIGVALCLPIPLQAAPGGSDSILSALDRGDNQTAARLAIAAMRGGDAEAEGLLLEAVMAGRPVLDEDDTARKAFPKYTARGDVVPAHAVMASDASRVMILHNETGRDITDFRNVATGQILRELPQSSSYLAGVSPDLATLAFETQEDFWLEDTISGARIASLPEARGSYGVGISSERRWLAVTLKDTLRVWNLTAVPLTHIDLPREPNDDGYLSPDGRFLISDIAGAPVTDFSKEIRDVATLTVRIVLKARGAIRDVFTQDSSYVVSSRIAGAAKEGQGWDWKVTVWSLETFEPVGEPVIMKDVDYAQTLPGGHLLALTTSLRSIYILDLRTHRFVGDATRISSAWRPGWRSEAAVTIDTDHVMHTYALDPALGLSGEALVVEACRRLNVGC